MVPFTRVTFKATIVTVLASRDGPTVLATKANGSTTKLTEKVNSGTQMATFTMEFGVTIKQTVSVYIHTRMVPSTKENGLTITNMAKESSFGLMAASTTASIRTV